LNSVTADISKSRNISVDKLKKSKRTSAQTPEMAKQKVDIAYEDVYHNAIKKSVKVEKRRL
jgi:protease-4